MLYSARITAPFAHYPNCLLAQGTTDDPDHTLGLRRVALHRLVSLGKVKDFHVDQDGWVRDVKPYRVVNYSYTQLLDGDWIPVVENWIFSNGNWVSVLDEADVFKDLN